MAMIISMKRHATREEIDAVTAQVNHFGYKVHSIEGEERVVIGVVGVGDVTACLESLEATPGVERAMRISVPYKFVSREFRKEGSAIKVNGCEVGGDAFIVMAGPCSVESEKQIMDTAEGVAAAGAHMLRGGAFKPRTSPYDFQGLEREGLKLLRKAKEATGLAIITEIMSDRDVDLVAEYADCMQVGARKPDRYPRRARYPHLRDGDAQSLRHRRHSGAQRADTPARGSRSEPRDRQAQPGPGRVAGRRGDRRRRAASRPNYQVHTADCVEAGIKLLKEKNPDTIVMDIRMPGVSGIEGLRQIREIDPHLSVIMLTGFGALDTAKEALRLGANDYISKPFDAHEMQQVIDRNVERTRAHRTSEHAAEEIKELNNRLLQQLAQKERLASLGQASAEFVHDLGNPLTIVWGYVQLLAKRLEKSENSQQDAASVKELNIIEQNVRMCRELPTMWPSYRNV